MNKTLLTLALLTPVYAMADEMPTKEGEAKSSESSPAAHEAKAAGSEATVAGKETICKQDSRVRKVTLSQGDDGQACKVSYLKESEADAKVLWSAKQKSDYCQEQATAFVEKLKSWGWSCQ